VKFGSQFIIDLAKFMNVIMQGGKAVAALFYGALEQIEKEPGKDPLKLLPHGIIGNIKPMVEVKSRRRGAN
jgi:ribosomal protein S7